MGLKERLRRVEHKGSLTRLRCSTCGMRWVAIAGENLEADYVTACWALHLEDAEEYRERFSPAVRALLEHELSHEAW